MALPTLTYDATNGSDSASSGAGPSTAVTGSTAAHTGGVSSTTITFTNSPDLSGVASDGSAVLWLDQTGTRSLSKITAVDDGADTVTVQDSFNIAAGSPVGYAIGGERKTLIDDSNEDWNDWKAGWTIQFDNGTYSVGAKINCVGGTVSSGPTVFKASAAATSRPIIQASTSGFDLFAPNDAASNYYIEGLKFDTSTNGATTDVGVQLDSTNINVKIHDCEFTTEGHCVFCTQSGCNIDISNSLMSSILKGCLFISNSAKINCSASFCKMTGSGSGHELVDFKAGSSGSQSNSSLTLIECEIRDGTNSGVGIEADACMMITIMNCTFVNNAVSGIQIYGTLDEPVGLKIANNIFWSNGTYGIEATDANFATRFIGPNAFGDNATAATTNVRSHTKDVTIVVDPFVNLSSDNYALNSAATGGLLLRDTAVEMQDTV